VTTKVTPLAESSSLPVSNGQVGKNAKRPFPAWARPWVLPEILPALLKKPGDNPDKVRRRNRKPVIYIFSPTDIDVSVTLSLTPDLRFSAIYPVVPTKRSPSSGQQVQWTVHTHRDGTLTETNTGLEVSYLFWESETVADAPLSPPRSPAIGQSSFVEHFDSTSCDLCDSDSVVLPVNAVTSYLDKTLKRLGLHTEARTSFITFWLPFFLKHKYISLRFVPQAAFERVAPLDISPKPDVVTRVFMLFKAVSEDVLESKWPCAIARAGDDVGWWTDVVGVNLDQALDSRLFRVLEWGGMEVIKPWEGFDV